MNGPSFLPIVCTVLLLSCGQSADPTGTGQQAGDPYQDMGALEARVAAITGRDLPMEQEPMPASGDQYGYTAGQAPSVAGQANGVPVQQGGTRRHTIHSQQFNVPMLHIELPARWSVKTTAAGDWSVDSPGLKVQPLNGGNFMYATGQFAQIYQAQGGQMRAPVAPEQLVQQELVPKMRQMGYELVGMQPAPGIAQADQRGLDGMYAIGQIRKVCQANISEWRKGNERAAMVLHWYAFMSQDMSNWGYRLTRLMTTADRFEQEKAALVNTLAGQRYDPAYFAAYVSSERQKEGQSWAAHNNRMQSNQRAFDARQSAHRDMVNSVNDAQMNTWRNTSNTMDRMQDATIDGIRGEQNAVNPYTGESYKIESGYDQYWMNSDGQYIGTNDVLYDPNVNGQWVDQWRQVPTPR